MFTRYLSLPVLRMVLTHGRPRPLLLPEPRLPALRPTRRRQPLGLRPLRQAEPHPAALLQRLQGPLLRAQGHAPVPLPAPRREGPRRPRSTSTRAAASARPDGWSASTATPSSGWPARRTACPRRSRRARGFFPLGPARSSSTRSGRSSPRSRRTATPTTRPMTTRGTGGTTSPSTPSTSWSWRWSPGRGSSENAEEVVAEVKDRLGDRPPALMTSDEYPAYETAIETAFGEAGAADADGGPGRPSALARAAACPGPDLRDGPQGAGEGPGRGGRSQGGAREPGGGGAGAEGVGVQPDDQHVVRGAAARDGPGPQRAEGAEDVPVQQGLAGSRGDDLLHAVQLQLLLAGADAAGSGTRMAAGSSGRRRWRRAWPITSGRSGNG